MSVRVNLLPREAHERQAAARQRVLAGAAGLVLLVGLGGAYWWQSARVDDARVELAAEQSRVAELQGEVTDLGQFADLQRRRDDVAETISTTLAGEISLAGILQDLAAVTPADAQLDSLGVVLGEEGVDDTTAAPTVGSFTANGQTLASHAPGVERFLLELSKVSAFDDLHVNSSSLEVEDEDYATFSLEGQLGPEVLTRRYAEGLPEELR